VTFIFLPPSLNFLNCPKFPNNPDASFQVSAGGTPSVVYLLSVSAHASPVTILPSAFTFQNAYATSVTHSGISLT
jgi:hypothetical protein